MEIETTQITEYAKVILKLLKQGVLYGEEQKDFAIAQKYNPQITAYFAQIGVGFVVDNDNNMAYLLQKSYKKDIENENLQELPNLTSTIPLTYHQTMMCVIVRDALLSSELKGIKGENYNTVTVKDLKDAYEKLMADKNDKTKQRDGKGREDAQGVIDKIADFGFLNKIGEHKKEAADETKFYEIKRIIKVRMNAEKLQEIKANFN